MNFIFKKIINFFDYINIGAFVFISEDLYKFEKNNIYDLKKTLDLVYENKLSLVRFGDGEISHCLHPNFSSDWQEASVGLSNMLSSILLDSDSKLMTCIPSTNAYDRWWKRYWINNWFPFKNKIDLTLHYGNSFITRPEFFQIYKEQGVNTWKSIWDSKDVIFITGDGSRFKYSHSLFSNISSYEIIYSRSRNAFSDLNRLINLLDKDRNKEKIFLIALGQAGTVLAYQVHKLGYRALDIGHIDRSYDYVFGTGRLPERVRYK